MKRPIRICMIGAGRVGKNHSRAISHHIPGGDIVALVDPMKEVREETASEFGIENQFDTLEIALEKVEFDAVVITTPTPTHLPLAALSAENKKHVFLEKPMALNLLECDAIIKVVEQKPIERISDETLILADMSRKAVAQVEAFVTELLGESGQMSKEKAVETARTLTDGRWTHDFPITVKAARELGLKVDTNMPKEVYALMDLYPQAPAKRPTVLYIEPPQGMRDSGANDAPASKPAPPARPEPRK